MIRQLEFSNKWNYYLCILLVPLLYEDIPPCLVMSSPKNRLWKKNTKKKLWKEAPPTNAVASAREQLFGHHSNKSLPSHSKSGQSCMGKWLRVWTAAKHSNGIPYHTIKYIWEVLGRTFTVVLELTAALSHRLSKAEKREGNGGSSGGFNTQFKCKERPNSLKDVWVEYETITVRNTKKMALGNR